MPEYQIVSELRSLVRSGFYTKQAIIEIFSEEICESCDFTPEEVASIIDTDMKSIAAEKATWPAITDCDRLDLAFIALNDSGVISLHNAGYTQSDAYDDIQTSYRRHPEKDSVFGYCFYHRQDLDRAVRGMGLYVAFGPMDANLEEIEGPKVGEMIRTAFETQGLEVEWDGTFNTRMILPTLTWQKR